MVLSAEKSFWMTLGCSVDQPDREAIQLPCGKIEYTESFKYLGVELTSDLRDTTDVDAKLARGRGTFKSLSKVFCSTALPVKLRVKLFQSLIVPTVLHGCEGWTLSRSVCDKLNVFQSRCLWTILGVRWQDHVSNESVRSQCEVPMSLAQLVRLRRLGWTGHVLRHNDLIVHDALFSRADYRGRGRHRTLVADLAADVSLVCNFANEDSTLPLNRVQFNSASSSFIRQAGDLGCFKCPSCAKPYISASWYQKHLSKCPQPTRAIKG